MLLLPQTIQVFDNMPAGLEGTLESGDEIVAVNGVSVKGRTKVEVAKMIQSTSGQSVINYNKLHADVKEGKSLDISMKKMKHRLVDNMSSATADALGLSRAILCNGEPSHRIVAAPLVCLRLAQAMTRAGEEKGERDRDICSHVPFASISL